MGKDQVRKLVGISQRTRVREHREGLINRKTSGHLGTDIWHRHLGTDQRDVR